MTSRVGPWLRPHLPPPLAWAFAAAALALSSHASLAALGCTMNGDEKYVVAKPLPNSDSVFTAIVNVSDAGQINLLTIYPRSTHERIFTTSPPTIAVIEGEEHVADDVNWAMLRLEPVITFDGGLSVTLSRRGDYCFTGTIPNPDRWRAALRSSPRTQLRDGLVVTFVRQRRLEDAPDRRAEEVRRPPVPPAVMEEKDAAPVGTGTMTFRSAHNGGNCMGCEWTAAEGVIGPDTPRRFAEFDAKSPVRILALHSQGGDQAAALDLGRMIREAGIATIVARTVPMAGENAQGFEDEVPGECAGACVLAFMGGTKRTILPGSRLGLARVPTGASLASAWADIQASAGRMMVHAAEMGIDPEVLISSREDGSEPVHWFDDAEIAGSGLANSAARQEPWRLEPYSGGLVLTTVWHAGPFRDVAATLFCRSGGNGWYLLISEADRDRRALAGDPGPRSAYGSLPMQLGVGTDWFDLQETELEFERVADERFYLSVRLPLDVAARAGQQMHFSPGLARAYGPVYQVSVTLPAADWLGMAKANCI